MDPIIKVRDTIKKYNMISGGDRVLVGLSGGADSVCLLLALNELKKELEIAKIAAAHINHHMRDTAGRDMEFSKKLCQKHGIEIYISDINIFELADLYKTSTEDAGRIARYKFFSELSEKYGFNKTATAHNMNDQAETLLMRIVSGTTLDGLSCIKPVRQDGIIRPLIGTKRSEIEDFLQARNQEYMTDETNKDISLRRNSIRLELLPVIEQKYNSSFIDTAANMVESFNKDAEFINKNISDINTQLPIDTDYLNSLDEAVLLRLLPKITDKKLSKKASDEIIKIIRKNRSGSSFKINGEKKLVIEYGKLYIRDIKDKTESYCVKLHIGKNYIKEADALVILSEGTAAGKNTVNVSDIENLYIRSREKGDRIFIKKIKGHKKIQDIFTDKKIPADIRDIWPVIVENDEIICVTGLYKNEKNNTKYNIKVEWRGYNV